MEIKKISPFLSVSSQIYPADMERIAALGFKTIINNRPDGETDGQPSAQDLAAEAADNGMVFIDQPVISGKVTGRDAAAFTEELKRARGPVLAFCRSGLRCTTLWALNEARHMDADYIMSFALSIGFNLKGQQKDIEQTASQTGRGQGRF